MVSYTLSCFQMPHLLMPLIFLAFSFHNLSLSLVEDYYFQVIVTDRKMTTQSDTLGNSIDNFPLYESQKGG